jgi:glycosidase
MVDAARPRAPILLSAPEYRVAVEIDGDTGLPRALLLPGDEQRWDLTTQLAAEIGGSEERHPTGGLRYVGTDLLDRVRLDDAPPTLVHRGTHLEFELRASAGDLRLALLYRLHPTHPFVEFLVRVSTDRDPVLIRGLRATLETAEPPGGGWVLNAPGNGMRRDVALAEFGDEPLGVSPIGGLRGSSGLVTVTDRSGTTLAVWANAAADIGSIALTRPDPRTLRLDLESGLSARIVPDAAVEVLIASLDLQRTDMRGLARQWPDWTGRAGLTTPPEKPGWIRRASIYEVQIGTSYFWGGHEYCRYPSIADFTADLDRVQSLGFDVVQLMPLQPYPSYNVHDYFDVAASYGDAAELAALIAECHRRGMRIILDVLLHGVIDRESIDRAEQGVRDGPLFERLTGELGDSFSEDVGDQQSYLIAWSRHILNFAPHWRAGSPERTPLQEQHPDWFFRSTDGEATGIYTKAFDARMPGWQDYFRSAVRFLLTEWDVDGFRFDAPTYNEFPNWSPATALRASASPLGAVSLFVDVRRDIKALKPDAVLYTEPSGLLLRRSMDVNYNYDEQWLVTALGATGADHPARSVRTAREFAEWMEDRDGFLPPGSLTAHHIDSHDTFWWPEWGKKWRREQLPVPVVRALAAAFMALEGPYMTFAGGEDGLEDLIGAMNALRADPRLPWPARPEFVWADDQDEQLLHVSRRGEPGVDILVNLSTTRAAPFALDGTAARVRFADGIEPTVDPLRGSIAPLGILIVERTTS